MSIIVVMLDRRATPDHVGLIPSFLDEDDDRPAAAQFNERYAFGGGWHPQDGFKLHKDASLKYPGDPPMKPLAMMKLRNEIIMIYPYGYVMILQPDGTFEASRMD